MPQTSNASQSKVPAGYVLNQSKLAENPRGESTYRMVGPQGQTVQVPFSKVRAAEDFHFQVVGDPSNSKSDAGRYKRDAAAVAPSFLHSLEGTFGVSPAQRKAEQIERQQHPFKALGKELVDAAGGPAYDLAKWVAQQAKQSFDDEHRAFEDYRRGNPYAAMEDIVHGVPILGPGLMAAVEQAPVSTGSYGKDLLHVVTSGPTMGTLLGTSIQAGLALDGLREIEAVVEGAASGGPPAGGSEVGGTSSATTEAAGADAATPPVDVSPATEASGAEAATSSGDAGPATAGTDATPTTPRADAGPATEATEPPSEGSDDDDDRGGGGASPAAPPVDAAATPAAADGSTFSSSFTRIVDALKASKLGQRAPDVLRGLVRTIFQDSPNLRFATPYGPMEMSPGEFFTQPAEVQDALKRSVIDPTSPGPQQGLGVSQRGTDGGGLEESTDARAQIAPVTAAPAGQTTPEGPPQPDAGTGAAAASTPATNPPDAPAPSDSGATGTFGGQTATEDSRPLRAYTAPTDTPTTEKPVYRKLTPAERIYKKRLEDAGHEVIQIPTGPYKTPDFLVDGKEMEYKKVTANGLNSIKNKIEEAHEQTAKGQIVIDASESEATVESALLQCERADGHLMKEGNLTESPLKGRVTVLTKSETIRY